MECPLIEIAGICINPYLGVAVIAVIVFCLFMMMVALLINSTGTDSEDTPQVTLEVTKEYYLLQRQVQINITWTGAGPEQILLTNHTNAVATIIFGNQYDVTLPSEVELQPKGHVRLKVESMPDSFVAIGTFGDGYKDKIEIERP